MNLRRFLPARDNLAAALAGALNTLAFAPFGFWPLAILSPLALYLLLRGLDARQGAVRGAWFGLGFWLAGVNWVYVSIHTYGNTPAGTAFFLTVLFAALLTLLFFVWWTALYAWLARGVLRPLLFVSLWVLAEWVRSWLLTGFPWLDQGYAFLDTPLAGFAPLGGVLLVSAVVLALAVLLVDLARGTRRARITAALAILLAAGGGWALSQVSWTTAAGALRTVSLVQGNIPQDEKWLLEMQQPTIDIYLELSAPEWGRDVVIWPESAIPMFLHEAGDLLAMIEDRARDSGSAFITGIPFVARVNGDYVFHNSVVALRGEPAIYHKDRLVPFGEFVPLAPLFRAIAPFFSLPQIPLEGFSRGGDGQPPLPAGDTALATFICYEIVYPDYVRRHALRADALLTLSNDAWFGGSHGPHQHLQIARMRALETGRWLLRGTNTGLTAIVDPAGRVRAMAPQFERTVLRGEYQPMRGATPFMWWGEWPLVLALLGITGNALRRRRRL